MEMDVASSTSFDDRIQLASDWENWIQGGQSQCLRGSIGQNVGAPRSVSLSSGSAEAGEQSNGRSSTKKWKANHDVYQVYSVGTLHDQTRAQRLLV